MKREWQVHHAVAEYPDGQRRWDYAYQFLLRWVMEETAEPSSQEDENEQQIERLQEAVRQHADWELAPEYVYRNRLFSSIRPPPRTLPANAVPR
jgi:cobyric acid synthase